MIEGCYEADALAQEHSVSKHVTAHVADTDDGEILGLGIDAEISEVPLDRLPGTSGRDAHRLVVVAHRASRCEGVAEPEPVFGRDLVREVGERGGALVCRDNEVGIVTVSPDNAPRSDDAAAHPVVRDIEQRRHELAVGRLSLREPCLPVNRRIGKFTSEEPTLCAHRHDDRVLHLLGLDEPEHLRAKILGPIAPAQASPGDRAESHVHPLDPRGVRPDLEHRLGERHIRDRPGIDLECEGLPRSAILCEVVRAKGRPNRSEEGPEDTVVVEAEHAFELALNLSHKVC